MRSIVLAVGLLVLAACGATVGSPEVEDGDGNTSTSVPTEATSTLVIADSTTSTVESSEQGNSTSTSTPDRGTSNAEKVPDQPVPGTGEVPNDIMEAILADAEGRTGIATADWEVIRSEAVVWSDGSLGCPEPGMAYTQAEVPGYWVEIAAPSHQLDYRADDRGSFKLCESGIEFPTEGSLPGDSVGPPTTSPDS